MIEGFGGYYEGLGAALPAGRTEGQKSATLAVVRTQLEQGLESLIRKAVEMGCINSENVQDALLERHSVDGALRQYLMINEEGTATVDAITSKPFKDKWKHSLQLMKKVEMVYVGADSNPGQLSKSSFSRQQSQSGPGNRKPLSASKAQSTEETLMSLGLAKSILGIQEGWRMSGGSNLESQGIITRRLADSATSFAVLLLRLLSFAAQEGHFQVIRTF